LLAAASQQASHNEKNGQRNQSFLHVNPPRF